MKYFTNDFWRMCLGFSLIVVLGLIGLYFVDKAESYSTLVPQAEENRSQ